jgi:hypothetical protein
MDDALRKKLDKPFPADKVKTKPGQGGRKMSYISHGLITERLNDTDPGWSSRHIATHTYTGADGSLHCAGVELAVTIGGVERVESGGPQRASHFTDEIKNAYSDALKRAAMRFGVALGMWETLVDAEGDEDYTDAPMTHPEPRGEAPTPIGAASAPNVAAIHAAATGKVTGDLHNRAKALAAAVYGVPSMRDLSHGQADRLRKAFGECRSPQDGEALIALAIRINAATSDDELTKIAKDIGLAELGNDRFALLRDAGQRARDAIKLMNEINANQPPMMAAAGTAGNDKFTH